MILTFAIGFVASFVVVFVASMLLVLFTEDAAGSAGCHLSKGESIVFDGEVWRVR